MSSATGQAHVESGSQPYQRDNSSRLFNALALCAVLLLAAFVRFNALDASSLWNDEGTTWALLARSFGQIAAGRGCRHPPAWLLLASETMDIPARGERLGNALLVCGARRGARVPRVPDRRVSERRAWIAPAHGLAGGAGRRPEPVPALLQPGSAHVHAAGRDRGRTVLGALRTGAAGKQRSQRACAACLVRGVRRGGPVDAL